MSVLKINLGLVKIPIISENEGRKMSCICPDRETANTLLKGLWALYLDGLAKRLGFERVSIKARHEVWGEFPVSYIERMVGKLIESDV